MRYEILPHTADGKFRAYGATLEEAFANAALATASLMWDWAKVEPRLEIPVDLRGRDREQLLVKFLGEIIYLLDTRKFLLGGVEGLKIEDVPVVRDPMGEADVPDHPGGSAARLRLTARLRGDTLSDRSEIYGAVKAVTYNEMKIERCACGPASPESGSGGYVVQVVVDM
jgi:SHS2 domain-containing protein